MAVTVSPQALAYEGSAAPSSGSRAWRRFAFNSYMALQKVDSRLLEPHLPAELFYNLLVSGRKPAQEIR